MDYQLVFYFYEVRLSPENQVKSFLKYHLFYPETTTFVKSAAIPPQFKKLRQFLVDNVSNEQY